MYINQSPHNKEYTSTKGIYINTQFLKVVGYIKMYKTHIRTRRFIHPKYNQNQTPQNMYINSAVYHLIYI